MRPFVHTLEFIKCKIRWQADPFRGASVKVGKWGVKHNHPQSYRSVAMNLIFVLLILLLLLGGGGGYYYGGPAVGGGIGGVLLIVLLVWLFYERRP